MFWQIVKARDAFRKKDELAARVRIAWQYRPFSAVTALAFRGAKSCGISRPPLVLTPLQ
jgi:hypothetical protein